MKQKDALSREAEQLRMELEKQLARNRELEQALKEIQDREKAGPGPKP